MSAPTSYLTRKMSQVRSLLRPPTRKGGATCTGDVPEGVADWGPLGRNVAIQSAIRLRTATRGLTIAAFTILTMLSACALDTDTYGTTFEWPTHTTGATLGGQLGAPTSPVALLARYDCWTGDAPADMEGKVPGHVVVTRDGRTVYGGPRLASQALAQIFEGVDHDLTVHGFCR